MPPPPGDAAASSSSSSSSSSGSSGSEDSGPPGPQVDVTNETFMGRTVTLAVPKTYDAQTTYPLVLVFHGDGGDGPGMRAYHTFDEVTGSEAIVAYPSGTGQTWDLYTPWASNAEAQFVEALIASYKGRFTIGDVFGVGWSNGGFFVNQIACRRPAMFRAIVSHAGGAPYEQSDPAATTWPNGYVRCDGQSAGVAAMITHGTADGAVGFDSGDFNRMYWAYVNGCGDTTRSIAPAPCVEYDGCPADKPVVFCPIQGQGHGIWDGARQAAWSFLKRF